MLHFPRQPNLRLLGDENEDLLATALAYCTGGVAACPAMPAPMMARSAAWLKTGPALQHRDIKAELRNGRMLWAPESAR